MVTWVLTLTACGQAAFNQLNNHQPVANNDSLTINEDEIAELRVLIDNDRDPDGDLLTIKVFGQPQHGKAIILGDNNYIYQPDTNYTGTDTFQYVLTDGENVSTAMVTIEILPVADTPSFENSNRLPVFSDQSTLLGQDAILVHDPDSLPAEIQLSVLHTPDNGQLLFKQAPLADGSYFTYQDVLLGHLSFLPDSNVSDESRFTLAIWDQQGNTGESLDFETQTVINNQPPGHTILLQTEPDISLNIAKTLLMGANVSNTTRLLLSTPKLGQLKQDALGNMLYKPFEGQTGFESISFVVQDDAGKVLYGLLEISINPRI